MPWNISDKLKSYMLQEPTRSSRCRQSMNISYRLMYMKQRHRQACLPTLLVAFICVEENVVEQFGMLGFVLFPLILQLL